MAHECRPDIVRQQAKGSKLTSAVKTRNAIRDIDIHPEVAKLLREFIGNRKSGLLFSYLFTV